MQYRPLGNTGVNISALALGTMTFGGEADEATAEQLYLRCRELGINFFDCADMIYQQGRAETILGKLIKAERDQVIISSKVYFPTSSDINARGLSRRHILYAVEQSLRRLNTDYLDIYFLHRFDPNTPLEETLRATDDLVRQGKVRYLGASNFAAWQIMKALGIAAREHLASLVCIQPMYNLVKRQAEVEILPMAQAEQLSVFSYSPLGGGLLTGKYQAATKSANDRLNRSEAYAVRYGDAQVQQAAVDFIAIAEAAGYHPVSLAIAWVMAHPAVTAPLLGARNLQQLEPALAALEVNLTPTLKAQLDALIPAPPLATDRNDEVQNIIVTHDIR